MFHKKESSFGPVLQVSREIRDRSEKGHRTTAAGKHHLQLVENAFSKVNLKGAIKNKKTANAGSPSNLSKKDIQNLEFNVTVQLERSKDRKNITRIGLAHEIAKVVQDTLDQTFTASSHNRSATSITCADQSCSSFNGALDGDDELSLAQLQPRRRSLRSVQLVGLEVRVAVVSEGNRLSRLVRKCRLGGNRLTNCGKVKLVLVWCLYSKVNGRVLNVGRLAHQQRPKLARITKSSKEGEGSGGPFTAEDYLINHLGRQAAIGIAKEIWIYAHKGEGIEFPYFSE